MGEGVGGLSSSLSRCCLVSALCRTLAWRHTLGETRRVVRVASAPTEVKDAETGGRQKSLLGLEADGDELRAQWHETAARPFWKI